MLSPIIYDEERQVSLEDYGWNPFFSDAMRSVGGDGLEPGRVLAAAGGRYRLITTDGERQATLAGRLKHDAAGSAELPAVGDWVAVRPGLAASARIEHVLPRRSRLSRAASGTRNDEQVVAANVDQVFIVMGLDGDFSARRLERLLTTVHESQASPVVLLNKADLCVDLAARGHEARRVAPGVPVLTLSCTRGDGVDAVMAHVRCGETAVLVGSSGVGKSTLINLLLGETVQRTRETRTGDDRGRHTTTRRELFRLANGGLLVDNPGIREVRLWGAEPGLDQAFDDVAALARHCRFRNCSHEGDTGCAVARAVDDGELDPARLASFHALRKELRYLEMRDDGTARQAERRRWRTIHKEMRRSGKHRRR